MPELLELYLDRGLDFTEEESTNLLAELVAEATQLELLNIK